jgi:hypothetical protein
MTLHACERPLRARQAMTDAEAEYAVTRWAAGASQRVIAAELGIRSIATVCLAIEACIRRHLPRAKVRPGLWGDEPGRLDAQGRPRQALARVVAAKPRRRGP